MKLHTLFESPNQLSISLLTMKHPYTYDFYNIVDIPNSITEPQLEQLISISLTSSAIRELRRGGFDRIGWRLRIPTDNKVYMNMSLANPNVADVNWAEYAKILIKSAQCMHNADDFEN